MLRRPGRAAGQTGSALKTCKTTSFPQNACLPGRYAGHDAETWESPRLVAVLWCRLFSSRAWDLVEPFCFGARAM